MVARGKRGAASLSVDDAALTEAARDVRGTPQGRRRRPLARDGGSTSVADGLEDEASLPLSPGQSREGSPVRARSSGVADREMEAVVKVFCMHGEPNFSLPWQRKRQFSSSGSGFAIKGRRLLTNAHCVDHATQVRVKRRGSDTKYVAHVLAVGHECDVALLSVESEEFWKGLVPLEFGTLPRLQDSIAVVGYPIGGDTMSVTSGVVSRIEVTAYVHGAAELLGVQVDAAINAGNSGGPAFGENGECVGIAFQSLKHEDAENISYIIPMPVVQHFIRDYEEHGRYTGFPSLGLEWQKMESPVLRSALGMKDGQGGVLVRRVEPTSPLSAVVKQGDVVLSFDGVKVGSDGTVPFRSGERIGFSYLVSQKYTGDDATLRILHEGQEKEVTVALRSPARLIPVHIENKPPSYYIVGGVVFTPVTVPLLRSEYGKEFDYDAPVKLLDKMMHAMAENESQQLIVLSQVLAADVNVGYEELVNTQLIKVNDKKVNNLEEFVKVVEETDDKYIRFDLEYNQVVILDKEAALASTQSILDQHCIPSDRSLELQNKSEDSKGLVAASNGAEVPDVKKPAKRGRPRKADAIKQR